MTHPRTITKTKPRLMFYCQHVLGLGHLVRSVEIVRGLDLFEVCFINGGEPIQGFAFPDALEVVNLPPLRANADFTLLETSQDDESADSIRVQRRERLLDVFNRFDPDIVVVELFPFGRKKFAFELLPLLARIRLKGRCTRVVCSLRDILVSKRDQARHEERVCRVINRYFDRVLVHADPAWHKLDTTFGRVNDLQCPIDYTGYVTRPTPPSTRAVADNVTDPVILATIGGGRVGIELLEAVVEASHLLIPSFKHELHVFTGPYLPNERFDSLVQRAGQSPQITVRRFTDQLQASMVRAELSVSMAGYNTCMDILTSGVRALVLPFCGGDNDEQSIRARQLAAKGVLGILDEDDLAPAKLAQRMLESLRIQPIKIQIDMDGVENTANALARMLDAPRPSSRRATPPNDWDEPFKQTLRPFLESLETQGTPKRVFLRDDDVDVDEETLRDLLDIILANDVPMNLEIIPATLDEAGTRLLKEIKRSHPRLVEFHQHGWRHINHQPEGQGKKCEFGPARSFAQQLEDIAAGKALLEEVFTERFVPVFTPPWNRCTEDTFRVLDELGFKALSRDAGASPRPERYHFVEVPITLDLYRWKGDTRLRPIEDIVADLVEQLQRDDPVGLMLHHKVMDVRAFSFLDTLLGELTRCRAITFCTFELLLARQPSERVVSGMEDANR